MSPSDTGSISLIDGGGAIAGLCAHIFEQRPSLDRGTDGFCLLYIGALGAGLALRSGDMVNVDLLCESLPGRMPWLLRLVSAALTVAFAAILLPAAWDYTMIGSRQTAPSLGWRMDFVHATQFILLVALGLWALMRIIEMLSGRHDGRPIPNSEEN